jgi:nucleoside-diphosphate-sugar epimerase
MKIFVTGGTGFIGSNFISLCVKNGIKVVAQRRPESQFVNLSSDLVIWVKKQLDEDFTKELEGCDALVHFASHSMTPPYAGLDECLYWNLTAPLSLLQQAASANIKRFVIAGSCAEYGLSADEYSFLPPNAFLKPDQPYASSKAAASIAFIGLAIEKKLELNILRIFQAYGEGERPGRFWPSLCRAAINGEDFMMSHGNQIRDFIHVSAVCDAFMNAVMDIHVKPGKPKIRNVGTGEGRKLIDFASDWWIRLGAKGNLLVGAVPLRPSEKKRVVAKVDINYEI